MTGDPAKIRELSTALNAALGEDPSASGPRRVARDDGFGRSSRFYEVAGRQLPSVTTILSAINKPNLVDWAAREERAFVAQKAADLYERTPPSAKPMTRAAYLWTLQRDLGEERAHRRKSERAMDIGTAVHARIEWEIRKELLQAIGPEPRIPQDGAVAFMAYEDWRKEANLSPVMCERTVHSERYGYAGTMDWAGEIDAPGWRRGDDGPRRVHVVGDFKTGRAIYAEARLQNAAYVHALVEMGHADPGTAGLVVRLPKTLDDPQFEILYIPAEEQKRLFKLFLGVLDLWRWLDEGRGNDRVSR